MTKIKVLVVDDSQVVREFFVHLLRGDADIEAVATACDGVEALETVRTFKPHIVTMDLHMPRMNGLQAIRQIMTTMPMPIVVVTDLTPDVHATFDALDAGAVAVIPRPPGFGDPGYEAACKNFLQTVKLMAEVKVVRRWNRTRPIKSAAGRDSAPQTPRNVRLVVIGASTGGPAVLNTLLSGLPHPFPAPIVIVQHIASGFLEGFVSWLSDSTGQRVKIAVVDETLQPGLVYVAPDHFHVAVNANNRVVLSTEPVPNRLCPSVSHLFQSVARSHGPDAVGILLTGMGRDGADGLLAMKQKGALTIVQEPESCVIAGMPEEAIKLGGACITAPPEKITETLVSILVPSFP
jgi:two-component system chemotaxis response regulator CheB